MAFLLVVALAPWSFAEQTQEQAAIAAAENFLHLVDCGRYADSWNATAQLFKAQVSRQAWADQLEHIRPIFGNTIKRTIKAQKSIGSLPGAPDGKYVVIQFSTRFANKEHAMETVTPMLESDGVWRVSGYYIQ